MHDQVERMPALSSLFSCNNGLIKGQARLQILDACCRLQAALRIIVLVHTSHSLYVVLCIALSDTTRAYVQMQRLV